jgi:CcmD family protein
MIEARNFTYMFYGFLAAWLVVMVYVVSLAQRGARLRRDLENVRKLIADNDRERATDSLANQAR